MRFLRLGVRSSLRLSSSSSQDRQQRHNRQREIVSLPTIQNTYTDLRNSKKNVFKVKIQGWVPTTFADAAFYYARTSYRSTTFTAVVVKRTILAQDVPFYTNRFVNGYESVTHPTSAASFSADVCETARIVPIRSTERDLIETRFHMNIQLNVSHPPPPLHIPFDWSLLFSDGIILS